ncbi:MAG: transglutaminase domain-containing protein [Archangium sp.]|nr:transglutaminase domain-containing protein [Archangium sp.]
MRSLFVALFISSAALAEAPLSDIVKVPRPEKGEFMGLYLKGQKIGYMYSSIALSPQKDTVISINEMHFRAKVGPNNISDRMMKETRIYESKPNGRLLSFVMEQKGDGGDQLLEGTALPTGVRVVRKKEGQPNEVKMLPPSKEVVEDADQARVALKRNATVVGTITDSIDLEQYKVTTTVGGTESRTVSGIVAKLRKVQTLSEKEKVPADVWVDEKGRMLEVHYGPMMSAFLEPEDKAKLIDVVEVFSLTRVTLPKTPLPANVSVPGSITLSVKGVPKKFWVDSYRQKWTPIAGKEEDNATVTITAAPPKVLKPRPLIDPNGGKNLKATIAVESDNPDIIKLAKSIVGEEKDAWKSAIKINEWVNTKLKKDYGSSSDNATGVLAQMKGDCTEHSLLAVALMRAVGIPAKRVDGLVYLKNDDGVPALYWHEWVEAYVGEWTQMDPTFGQNVAHPARLAVGEESSAEITPLIGSMTVLDVK